MVGELLGLNVSTGVAVSVKELEPTGVALTVDVLVTLGTAVSVADVVSVGVPIGALVCVALKE
jgi:hypothetical protein